MCFFAVGSSSKGLPECVPHSQSTVSPWDAGRATSAWCWWRVWAEPPSCSWTSCLRCPTGTTGPCLPSGGEKEEQMVQLGLLLPQKQQGEETSTGTPASVTMVTELELTLLETTVIIWGGNGRSSWRCGRRRRWEVWWEFGASSWRNQWRVR